MARSRARQPKKSAPRSAADRTRRRFARRQWTRRWLTWRYLLAAFVLIAGVGFGIYAVYFSAWLRAEGVQVVGLAQLSEKQVLGAAEVKTGGPLARVDLDAIEYRVRSLATVKSVRVTREWPHDIRIEVVERTPIAIVDRGDSLTQLDATGHTFGSLRRLPNDLPRVVVGSAADKEALAEVAEVIGALDSSVSKLIDHVEVDTVDRITLALRDGRQVRWGSAEQSEEKARVLLALLKQKARVYDVSVPGLPTTR